jgi:hypothetical protein
MRLEFTNSEIDKIVDLYTNHGLNTSEVGKQLGVIPWEENLKKRANCSITIEQLINE